MLWPNRQEVISDLKKLAFTIAFAVALAAAIVFEFRLLPVLVLLAVLLAFFSPLPLAKSIWAEHRKEGKRRRLLYAARVEEGLRRKEERQRRGG